MIDLHSHILPGVDDGAPTAETALEMARDAVADGVTTIAATPHVRSDYPTSPERMERLVDAMQSALHEESIPIQLLPGGEIGLDLLFELEDDELRRFGLGGNPGFLLVEFPYFGRPLGLAERMRDLYARGFVAVLAHPERNAEVQARPSLLLEAVEAGALVQVTAASLDGRLGRRAKRTSLRLLDLGLTHLLASDAHTASVRQIGMSAAGRAVGDEALAQWLTYDVPASIVNDTDIPPRPSRGLRRRVLSWRRGLGARTHN